MRLPIPPPPRGLAQTGYARTAPTWACIAVLESAVSRTNDWRLQKQIWERAGCSLGAGCGSGQAGADTIKCMTTPGLPVADGGAPSGFGFDIYQQLLSSRIVFLGQQVDDTISNAIAAQMLYLALSLIHI